MSNNYFQKCNNNKCLRCTDNSKFSSIWNIIRDPNSFKYDIVIGANGFPVLKQTDYFDASTVFHTLLQMGLTFIVRYFLGYIDNDSMVWFSTPLVIMAGFIQIVAAMTYGLQNKQHDFVINYNRLANLPSKLLTYDQKVDILSMCQCDGGIAYFYYEKYPTLCDIFKAIESPYNHGDNIRIVLYLLCVYCIAMCVGPILYVSNTYSSDILVGCFLFLIYFLMNIFYYICCNWQKPFTISNLPSLKFY